MGKKDFPPAQTHHTLIKHRVGLWGWIRNLARQTESSKFCSREFHLKRSMSSSVHIPNYSPVWMLEVACFIPHELVPFASSVIPEGLIQGDHPHERPRDRRSGMETWWVRSHSPLGSLDWGDWSWAGQLSCTGESVWECHSSVHVRSCGRCIERGRREGLWDREGGDSWFFLVTLFRFLGIPHAFCSYL